jgi:hypothetical protein
MFKRRLTLLHTFFGLDKLHNIERTVNTFAKVLDQIA